MTNPMYFTRASRIHLLPSLPVRKFSWLIIFLVLLQAPSSLADTIYRSVDAHGRITYSDIPTPAAKPLQLDTRSTRVRYRVTKVIDGDTVVLENGKRARLLGINAPEIESRHRPGEPGGIEAKNWLHRKLQGRSVYLEYDRQKYDRYKRILAHLYLPDGEHINLSLVEKGLAAVSLLPPNLLHAREMLKAQQRAETRKLGIWSMKHYHPRQLTSITGKSFGWQRYRVKITALKRNRRYSRLIVNDKIDLTIANRDLALFPPLETYLKKPLEVRGWVSRKKDRFFIRVHHPSVLIPY